MEVTSTVVVPVRRPFLNRAVPGEWTDSGVDEIIAAAEDVPVLDHWGDRTTLSAFEIPRPSDVPYFADVWQPSPVFSFRYLCFRSSVQVDEAEVRSLLQFNNPDWNLDEVDIDDLIRQLSAEATSQAVAHVLMAAQLAKPGAIHAATRTLISTNRFIRMDDGIALGFEPAMSRAARTGWPTIKELDTRDTLRWLLSIPGLVEGQPTGPAARAIAALAALVIRPAPAIEDPVGLMWCMVGLEALYGEGQANLTQQLSRKSRVVLGEPESFRKAVSRLYQVRSRFIHGDVDFPLSYYYQDHSAHGFSEEMSDAVQLALSVLVATLQSLVERREFAFEFEYRLARSVRVPD